MDKCPDKSKTIHILKSSAETFAKDFLARNPLFDQPFYTCNLDDIVAKYDLWQEALPRVKPFYAVKCNDKLPVLQTLSVLGLGFDCATKAEIQTILSLGVASSRIVYANPTKMLSHLRAATELHVDLMTFDNKCELHKIKQTCPKARLLIRLKCDDASAVASHGMKFGCDVTTEVGPLLQLAEELALNVVGVAFHVGFECNNPLAYSEAIEQSQKVFDVAKELGFNLTVLDIGGGFPGNADKFRVKFAPVIRTALDRHFPEQCNVDLIAEPGNFFAHSSAIIYNCVHSLKEESNGHRKYYLNDGLYGTYKWFRGFPRHFDVFLRKDETKGDLSSSFWGPTCDGSDCVVDNVEFPRLNVGDWVCIRNVGAYWLQVHCNFNGFEVQEGLFVVSAQTAQRLDELQKKTNRNLLTFTSEQ